MADNSITILGSGTSTGVPQLCCDCAVCRSTDPHDNRLRQSALIRRHGKNILIDCGPDFRQQMLRCRCDSLDALLLTHIHYDHVGGLDDLRPYARQPLPIYARADVLDSLRRHQLRYCFGDNRYPGAPQFEFREVDDNTPFDCCDLRVTPVPILHNVPILGYRFDNSFAYISDCKTIDDKQIALLHAIPLLIINALRVKPHPTHLALNETLDIISRIKPGRAVLIHMSHEIGLHADVQAQLPHNVTLAYDGLTIPLP